jgi:hypothetical protein
VFIFILVLIDNNKIFWLYLEKSKHANNQMGIKIYQVICKHDTKCVNKTCDRKGLKEVYNYDDYERQILK